MGLPASELRYTSASCHPIVNATQSKKSTVTYSSRGSRSAKFGNKLETSICKAENRKERHRVSDYRSAIISKQFVRDLQSTDQFTHEEKDSINDYVVDIGGLRPSLPRRYGIWQTYSGLRQPLPTMNFMGGLPVVPGVLGSLPGAGACLPRGAPLVRDKSPSFFQNMIRNIPGVHDYLASLLPAPMVNIDALLGKYYWAIDTPSVHNRFCATTEFTPTAQAGNSSSFSLQEKFRTQNEDGGEKVAFGYGIIHAGRTYVYMQDDPCPYQIVLVGPRKGGKGQYEYVILSNWARFPLIGLVRDIRVFYKKYKDQLETELEKEGFINDYSGSSGIHYADLSKCRPATPVSYIQNVLSELFG